MGFQYRPILIVVCIGAGVLLQEPLGTANAERRRNDFRYTPRPEVMKIVAGAHRSTMADTLWLRTLPDMARPFEDQALKKRWLDGVLTVVTDLEPSFTTAYQYGADYLLLVSGRKTGVDEAIAFLEKGIERNPDNLLLRVSLAMAYFEGKKDRGKTLEHLEIAADDPMCPDLTLSMLAAMRAEDGEYLVALAYWEGMLEHGNARVRERALRNYEITKKKIVNEIWKRFEEEHGRPPAKKDEFADSGLVPEGILEMLLDCFELHEDGTRTFPLYEAADRIFGIRAVEGWTRLYLKGYGRWPTMQEIYDEGKIAVPDPLPGKRWAFDRGKLTEVDK